MPELSRFFGIVIYMFYDDHNPPHFHACYGDHESIIDIRTLSVLRGSLPPRVLGLVMEWAALRRNELEREWTRALEQKPLNRIRPLE